MNNSDSGMLHVEIAKVHRDKNELCEMEDVIEKALLLLEDSPYLFEALVIKAEALVEIGKKDQNSCERVGQGLTYFRQAIECVKKLDLTNRTMIAQLNQIETEYKRA